MSRVEQIAEGVTLYLGDCREILPTLGRVDAVLTDPPYGTTQNKWDVPVPFSVLWSIPASVFVLTASQPFTAKAILSKEDWFCHEWIWIKNRGSNFANSVREPMKEHESVLVFSPGKWTYNKQMQDRTGSGADRVKYDFTARTETTNYGKIGAPRPQQGDQRVPSSWQKFDTEVGLHPTQKPVPLFGYLARTYSNAGDTILDPFMGSGTTGVAAVNLGRNFIGIDEDTRYFDIACRRISEATKQQDLFIEKPKPAVQLGLLDAAE